MASINWAEIVDIAEEERASVPNGEYTVTCDRTEAGTTSTDKEMIKVIFHVEGGAYSGKVVNRILTLSPENPKAVLMFVEQLQGMGLTKSWIADIYPAWLQR